MRFAPLNARLIRAHRRPRPAPIALAVLMAFAGLPEVSAGPRATALVHTVMGGECGRADRGYLRSAGPAPFRWLEAALPAVIARPPVVLYAPPAESSASPAPAATGAPPASSAGPDNAGEKKPSIRPEDFLPFFESGAGSTAPHAHGSDGLLFVPAQPALPTSSAEYKQK